MTEKEYLQSLPDSVREMVGKTDGERLQFIRQQKFIRYQKAETVLKRMQELMDEPTKERMPALLLLGDSGNGKTSIARKFVEMHTFEPSDPNDYFEDEGDLPVLFVQAPIGPNASDLYDNILRALDVPSRRDSKSVKEGQIEHYFRVLNVRMMIVDEIHNILSGTVPKKKEFMNALKNLSNSLQIPIVLIGIKDALNAVNTDLQIRSRFKPIMLNRWGFDREYLILLKSIEKTIPLKKPSLIYRDERFARAILDKSNGLFGEIMGIISMLAKEAIVSGREKMAYDMLKSLDYAFLSDDDILLEEL